MGIKDPFQLKSPPLERLVQLTYFVFASFNKEGSSVAKYTLFLSTCTLRARSWKCSSTCTMYSSMGWKAASVPTLSVRLTWTLGAERDSQLLLKRFCSTACSQRAQLYTTVHSGILDLLYQFSFHFHLKKINMFKNPNTCILSICAY